jgi:hypothetical protein
MKSPSWLTLDEQLRCIATETARMSYPGSMSRGTRPVVSEGTKATLEAYFAERFPLRKLWTSPPKNIKRFDNWHRERVEEVADAIRSRVCSQNKPRSVAAKFINTFLHQLTKYEEARSIVPFLHLPLDRRVFDQLRELELTSDALKKVQPWLEGSPYQLKYDAHVEVQEALLHFLQEVNSRPGVERKLSSRIELNWLWLKLE